MKKLLLILFSTIIFPLAAQQWQGALEARLNLDNEVPFWLRSNQYGSTPLSGGSATLLGRVYRDYKETDAGKKQWIDWGIGLEGRADVGEESRFRIIEGYGKLKLGFLEARGGRIKEFLGLTDSTLSMGSFAISGNALGIPKIELRVPEYWPKNTLIAARGNYAHGWYGYIPTRGTLAQVDSLYTYFHQKSLWIRIARPYWKLKLYGGFADNAYWGDEYKLHESFTMSKAQRYWSVVSGKVWQDSKVGNHVGNIDIRAEYDVQNYRIAAYRQFFYEVGALWHLANIADGLMGVMVQKKSEGSGRVGWNKLLLELLYTKNQAGEPWSKPTPTGNENYHNHYLYNYGWSYRSQGLGTPFITPRHTANEGFPYNELEYFVNNRLWGLQAGFEGKTYDWDTRLKLSYSRNFGTRRTESRFPISNQFSFCLEGRRNLAKGFTTGFMLASDVGELLPHATGLTVSLEKRF
ncbi:capsule assembly Wzi family protein [Leadbetterella sp. DM7]|uniref:capsule assembly Wzi family protein n=1 Tax=Leadbetterella sp. DM7 TaxID=3235085 RepID=UPI00349EA404